MKRSLAGVAIVLIAVNAALAVVILALGEMGDTEGRILGTSLLATFSALLAMLQVPALQERRRGVIPLLGITACVAGFVMATVTIWGDIRIEAWNRSAGSAYVIAVASGVAAILSGWPIRGRGAWVGGAADLLTALAALMILGGLWFNADSEGYWRTFAVVAVLLAAAGLAVPILHRSSVDATSARIEHCPFCGSTLDGAARRSISCSDCSRVFRVRLEA